MMACPICGGKTRVLETRMTAKSARRRRGCQKAACAGKLTTVEVVVSGGRPTALATGCVVVSARQVAQLRALVAKIDGKRPTPSQIETLRALVAQIEEAAL